MVDLLKDFDPTKGGIYDPGQIVVLFDNRHFKGPNDKMAMFQSYYVNTLYRLGWPAFQTPNLAPGFLRLVWYTHAGSEGHRDFPLHKAYAVKEMFDSLSEEAFRPMIMGWSGENPFPMIGGSEPPPEPTKEKPKVSTTWSGAVSGHSKDGTTPHDRVMAIIDEEAAREAKARRDQMELAMKAEGLGLNSAV